MEEDIRGMIIEPNKIHAPNRCLMNVSIYCSGKPLSMNSSKRRETMIYLLGCSFGRAFLVLRAKSKNRRLRVLLLDGVIVLLVALIALAM